MHPFWFVIPVTLCYSAYNLLVKVSGSHIGAGVSPIVATICLQLAALSVSLVYLCRLIVTATPIAVPASACVWAIAAGLFIGSAEVFYFYLFRVPAQGAAVEASSAIPIVVGGTIAITLLLSVWLLREPMNVGQWVGVGFCLFGVIVLYATTEVHI